MASKETTAVHEGIVFDIKRFAVHDGPGIRTSIFTKGCSLRCSWCQNPEGIHREIQIWYFPRKCIRCGACASVCPENAITIVPEERNMISEYPGELERGEHFISIDRAKCTRCGICVQTCPAKAIVFDGWIMSSDEVFSVIIRDELFYQVSGGGATFTGGEPLSQPDFNLEIAGKCRNRRIHTAAETCLMTSREVVKDFSKVIDLFLADIKFIDSKKHREYTGSDNSLILENLEYLVSKNASIIIRLPLIPGATATEENIRSIAAHVHRLDPDMPIELINYNPLAKNKYRLMELSYPMDLNHDAFSVEKMEDFRGIISEEGINPYRE